MNRRQGTRCLLVVCALARMSPALAADVGTIPGVADVSGGSSSYSIPISVPPGIAGLVPKLSITYNSRASDGLLGHGAALAGLSQIVRCQASLDPDGYVSAVNFTASDRYCLDGKKLLAYSGTYGSIGAEYRTELESFSRILSIGGSAGDPQSFKVYTKSGLILEFGNTTDSRIAAQGKTQALVWAVNKISDTAGNYITVTYSQTNSTGEYHPTAINYAYSGGTSYAQVSFAYVNRPDIWTGYTGGSLITHSQLMSTITTYANGNFSAYVRQYTLGYVPQSSVASQRSLLASVTECGITGCLPPTQINWQNGTNAIGAVLTTTGEAINAQNLQIIDVNGDGREDLVYPAGSTWHIRFAQADGSFGAPIDTGIANTNYQLALPIDYNGDGLGDLLVPDASNNWQVLQSNGSGFTVVPTGLPMLGASDSQTVADVNGDGLADLVWVDPVAKQINVRLNSPSGLSSTVQTFFTYTGAGFGHIALGSTATNFRSAVRTADFNGDGQTDLLVLTFSKDNVAPDGRPPQWVYTYYWNTLVSTGTSFNVTATIDTSSVVPDEPLLMDLNGDGKTDVAFVYNSQWTFDISRGDGSFVTVVSSAPASPPGTTANLTAAVWFDFDGDGRTDLLVPTGTDWYWQRSTGSDISATFVDTGIPSPTNTNLYPRVIDPNGDGLPDLAFANGSNLSVSLHQGSFPDLATQVTNGLGSTTQIDYKPLTNTSIYAKGSGSSYPVMDIQKPIYAVSERRDSNGLGALNRITYTYTGAKLQLRGRGFLGFAQQTANDLAKGIVQTTSYRQDFPFIGALNSAVTTLATGVKVSDSTTSYSDHPATLPAGGTSHFVFPQHSVTHSYEINGTNPLILSQVSDSTYDESAYIACSATTGNLTTSTILTYVGSEVGNSPSFTSTTHNTYCDNSSSWLLGRLTKTAVTRTNDVAASTTRTSSFEYDPITGLLSAEVIEPGNATLQVRTEYLRDTYGNITQTTVKPVGLASRITTTTFDVRAQFPVSTTNAVGLTSHPSYDPGNGNILSRIDPNNLTTRWSYDGYGRMTLESRPDGTSTSISRTLCGGSCASGYAIYFATATDSNGSSIKLESDLLDRPVAKQAIGFNGSWIQLLTEYNAQGRVSRASNPHFASGAVFWTTFQYDGVLRLFQQNAPDSNRPSGSITTFNYSGLTTQQTDPLNNPTTSMMNAIGELVQVTDAANRVTSYAYDPFGNLLSVTLPGPTTTTMQYNIRGFKTAMSDPDMGSWSYQYDSLGELIQQTDAKNQTSQLGYDAIGRMTSRIEAEGSSSWAYDKLSTQIWNGALLQETSPGVTRNFSYDTLGRVSQVTTTLDAGPQSVGYSYDSQSRVNQTTYPDGFIAQNNYNTYGYLLSVASPTTNVTYWTANAMDARANVSSFTFGNNIQTTRTFDDATGVLKTVQSSVQSLAYTWDTVNNLQNRTDNKQAGLTEQFTYDALYRLQSSTLNGTQNISLTYDLAGNISSKSGVGTYSYGTLPHAVSSVTGPRAATYTYDANGNMTSGAGRTIGWTSYNYPNQIAQNGNNSSFVYGPEREMAKQTLTRTVTRGASPVVAAPTASFTFSCTGVGCSFDASASSDPTGISSYSWTFGDGQTATGVSASHTYSDAGAGTYTVTLTVTGTDSQSSTATASVAAYSDRTKFTYTCAGVSCSFDASDSRFHPGISSYSWNFGDGQTGTGAKPSHTYSDAGPGSYTVTLTITNSSNQTSSTSTSVVAYSDRTTFSFNCTGLVCSFDGSDSRYHPGITSYSWNFGDGQSSSDVKPVHTYYASGTYAAALTITNTSNATSTVSRAITAQVGMQNNSLLCGDLALPAPICPTASTVPVLGTTAEPNTGPVSLPAGSNTMYAPPADLDGVFSVSWSTASASACPGSCQYQLEVATNSSFINSEVLYRGLNLNYQINGMNIPATYYFRVSAIYPGGQSAYFTGPYITVVGAPVLTGPSYASSSSGTQTGSTNVSSASGTQNGASNSSNSGGPGSMGTLTEYKTIYYAGGIYEFDSQSGEKKHFIVASGETVAVYTTRGTLTGTRYLHSDHLGSVSTTTDESGHAMENLSYDSFGKRRMSNWADDPNDTQLHTQHAFDQGFTYQNHLDHVGLISMKGRIYDPILGRFASADPSELIKALGHARYAYASNNPLTRIDPTGFDDEEPVQVVPVCDPCEDPGPSEPLTYDGGSVDTSQFVGGSSCTGCSVDTASTPAVASPCCDSSPSSSITNTSIPDPFQLGMYFWPPPSSPSAPAPVINDSLNSFNNVSAANTAPVVSNTLLALNGEIPSGMLANDPGTQVAGNGKFTAGSRAEMRAGTGVPITHMNVPKAVGGAVQGTLGVFSTFGGVATVAGCILAEPCGAAALGGGALAIGAGSVAVFNGQAQIASAASGMYEPGAFETMANRFGFLRATSGAYLDRTFDLVGTGASAVSLYFMRGFEHAVDLGAALFGAAGDLQDEE